MIMMQPSTDGFRLSPQQRRLWLVQQADPSPAYTARLAICIAGDLETSVLEAALRSLVARHEILRTDFHCMPGVRIPVQVIGIGDFQIEEADLGQASAEQREELLAAWPDEVRAFRARLVRLGAGEGMLQVCIPGLCSDAAGLASLFAEIVRGYETRLGGEEPGGEPLQYADLAEWQNDLLESGETELGREHWRRVWREPQTPGAPSPSGAKSGFQPCAMSVDLGLGAAARVGELAERLNASPRELLLTCWQALLWRLQGGGETVVGVAFDGRRHEVLAGSLGLLTRILPVRFEPHPGSPFATALAGVAEACAEASQWQEYFDFAMLPHQFDWMEIPKPRVAGGVTFSVLHQHADVDRFEIQLSCSTTRGCLGAELRYDGLRIPARVAELLSERFAALLGSVLATPQAPLEELEILGRSERRLLEAINESRADWPLAGGAHRLFEEQADRCPEAPAVVGEGRVLSYGELDEEANRLARYLRRLGVGPEVLVGVCAERSPQMVAGLLAVLKAGGVFVPLDPSYPRERLAWMLADSAAPVLLTHSQVVPALPTHGARVVLLDADAAPWKGESPERLPDVADPAHPAYVIYTSGSTGKPKGVVVLHHGLRNHLHWVQSVYGLTSEDRILQKTPLSFDVAVREIFWPLSAGACLILARPGGHQDVAYLAGLVAEHGITVLNFVPSLLQAFLEEPGASSCGSLRRIVSGGEALLPELARRCLERLPVRLHNQYGPTETTITATWWTVEEPGSQTVPIGRPVANARLYVLDRAMGLVPLDLEGELFVGGAGLARGYLGRPDLTAERFVPDPFSGEPGGRLYRTGDLVRLGTDGALRFLGRIDDQVKVRGFRVELGEIESVLAAHPAVQRAVVVAPRDESGRSRLVAYVVDGPSPAPAEELRRFLQEMLPEHMVPSAWVRLDSLPLTPSGKVNRRALPAPEEAVAPGEPAGELLGPVQEMLAGIWAHLLGPARIGSLDDFFALGGHSLLATQLISRVRDAFHVEMPLRTIFEAPRLADLAGRIEAGMRAGLEAQLPPLVRVSRDGIALPLSSAQRRLWFLHQLEPGSPAYNIPAAVRLYGHLDVPVLRAALGEIVRRHEILRTTFPSFGGQPSQLVHPPGAISLPVIDLRPLAAAQKQAQELVDTEVRRPFDLAGGPLWRAHVFLVGDEESVLLMTLHHVVTDGWSSGILVREMVALYTAFSSGAASPLPELPVQYADYAVWQRAWLQGETLGRELAYWRSQLADIPTSLELPTDRPRPAVWSYRGSTRPLALDSMLSERVEALCRRCGVTLFMTLLAAFQTLLHRYTGQVRVPVGSPIAGRDRSEIEGLIGFFINTLVVNADLAEDPGFSSLLHRVREVALAAHAHQSLPFERLVDELRPERNLSHTPLFQVVLVVQNTPQETFALPGLRMSLLPVDTRTAKFDLTLVMGRGDKGLAGYAEYNSDLFDTATVDRLLGHLACLLSAAVNDPETALSELPLLTEAERHQVLRSWNGEAAAIAAPVGTIHARFEAQAARQPHATAAIYEGERITYAELDVWANRIARRLLALGVGPEIPVGVCLEPSPGVLAALLGVLKSGGAYVPLDPAYPRERIAFTLEDAGISVVVTEERLVPSLPDSGVSLLRLEADRREIERESSESPGALALSSGNLAYVIYTSGSTGRPKGVQVTHGNVLRLLDATEPWFGFGLNDVWTLFHSFAFDFSVWEMWGALLYGGSIVVVPRAMTRSPEDVYRLLVRHGVTVLNQTPSAFRQLIRAEQEAGLSSVPPLRWIVFGGEALELQSLRPWIERHGDAAPGLVNMYGITETTVHVTYRPVRQADLDEGAGSVIGVPIPDLSVYVLDARQQPLPIGVPGEICVGGAGVSRGYLGRPGLTAERFVPDPFGTLLGSRLYRSGDLGRLLQNGDLEYLGRIDDQVKIRGFRIELGEIEAALTAHPALRETVVVARPDAAGERRLVAYVVPQGSSPAVEDLRSWLHHTLPEYMVPAAFVVLPMLPLTPNGKIDRRALPEPERTRSGLITGYMAPRTPAQEVLVGVWSQVLGIGEIGIRDNFFALGGDSIRSIQVVALTRERGLPLNLPQLFQFQTIAELAAAVEDGEVETLPSTSPFELISEADGRLLPERLEDAYPLALLQAGMLYHMDLAPEEAPYHNVDSWWIRAPFSADAFQEAVDRVVARHPMLRTSFDMTGFSEPLQLVHREASMPVLVGDLRGLTREEQERFVDGLVRAEKRRLFDFARPPQLRFFLHRRTEDTFQFTLTENHAIFDGWSVHATLGEIFSHYFALLDAAPLPAEPPLALTYRDFIAMERQTLESEQAQRYWDAKLRDSSFIELPARSRPRTEGGHRFRVEPVAITDEMFSKLKELAREAAVPLKSVLLAMHLKVMSLVSGQNDVVTGVVTNGRPERLEGEQLRGLFLNMVPLRVDLGGGSWVDLVRRTFAAEREMLPFRRYPYAALQRRWGRAALVDVVFNYIHFHVVADLLRSGRIEVLDFKKAEGSNFKLHVVFAQHMTGSGLRLSVEYDTWAVDEELARRIADFYRRVLAAITFEPARRHDAEPLLDSAELQRLMVEWNDTHARTDPRGLCELFEEQAARSPDAVAVSSAGGALSYGELNRRANRLSRALAVRGVGPESVVPLLFERGPDLLAAMLAVFKAGGAYLPLDPSHPPVRQAQTLQQSGAVLVLAGRNTRSSLESAISGCSGAAPRGLVFEELLAEEQREDNSASPRRPHSLSYVIYTSGSTGVPKGAMVVDRGMVNHLHAKIRDLGLSDGDVVAQTASQCFDISVWQFLAPLVVGGRVHVVEDGAAHDPLALVRSVAADGITVLETVPSLLRLMLDETGEAAASLGSLRWMISTGEALPPRLCLDWLQRFPGTPLLNAYGPTECSDDVTHCALHRVRTCEPESVPVGHPILNTRIYLLDAGLQPVPVGVTGEIWVGGDGVGRGYLHDPLRTADVFLPDPFGGEAGARLYRTGDLGRHLPDGEIEFLGRIDHQVKIRGFRIEIGEIEAVLGTHPAVAQAVVLAREDAPGDKRIAAYVVPHSGEAPGAGEIQAFLRERLPAHMVPAAVVLLPELPLTANGKIDRKSLPVPELEAKALSHLAPQRSPMEDLVAAVFCEVLRLDRTSPEDDFFALGGHSLTATRVVSRVRRSLGAEVPLRLLFDAPTVSGFASRLEAELRGGSQRQAPRIEALPRAGGLPLSFAQQRLWILAQLEPDNSAYNMPKAVLLSGRLNVAALTGALTELVRRHEVLRTTFHSDDEGRAVQVIALPSPWAMPLVDLTALPAAAREGETQRLARQEGARAFDLACGPLMRATLVQLDPDEHLVLFALHHIVSDFWSMAVLVREVSALYDSLSRGLPSPLPPLPIQYADFAAWQRAWIQGEVLEDELSYWRQRLAAPAPPLYLGGRERPEKPTWRGAQCSFRLPQSLSQKIAELGRREGVTLFMTLLAGLEILLYRRTGQTDLVVGTDIANRNRAETESLIGFFVNLLALRVDLSGGPRVRDVMARVREVALGAYAHQDLPFDQLVRALRPERTLAHSPLFDILFVLQNAPEESLDLPGLALRPYEIDHGTSRFELSLFLAETPEGIAGSWVYKSDLYDSGTIDRLSTQYTSLLEAMVRDPDSYIDDLELQTAAEKKEGALMEPVNHEKPSFRKLARIKPRAVSLPEEGLVLMGPLDGREFPLVVEPNVPDIDLAEWAAGNRELIEDKLAKHGAILFRGFQLPMIRDFEKIASAICPDLYGDYGDLPREKQGESEKIYESTPYPPDKTILFHNESSHMHMWPLRQFFYCATAAQEGGETPIVDCRRIYKCLDPELAEKFETKGLLYVRNFTGGLDVSWQEFFHTDNRTQVEAWCLEAGIECEWREGDRLRTRKAALAVATHPKTGEKVFFNQLQLHHVACLEPEVRESLQSLFSEEDLPRNVCYGDGTPIENPVVDRILEIYWKESARFRWREGDLLALDNMLVAHARNPFRGPRKIAVAMGRMLKKEDLPAPVGVGSF
ncbi:MAG TPA: amino acid adenylation domain-containing protein [Thermoanaerobaculia bacterium]|nr:amino acid adenylation domain-containing protein [Thermoanaerobaculia bacterium]